MEILENLHQQYLQNLNALFERPLSSEINWKDRMIGLCGARGVGKTTFLIQHIKNTFGFGNTALYVSMDHVQIFGGSLLAIAEYHHTRGGTHLYIDEIHKSQDWSLELKALYDLYPKLHFVFTSSSILEIYKGTADLSRRVVLYEMNGLSFREFIQIESAITCKKYSLDEVLHHHLDISHEIISKGIKPLKYLKDYLTYGYYPFFLENRENYAIKLLNIINQTLEIDLLVTKKIDINNIPKLKKLLSVLSQSVPFQPNISKLAGSIEITRPTLLLYLQYLAQSKLLHLLQDTGTVYNYIAKPEKVFLHNTNLIMSLQPENYNSGTMRETFFINTLAHKFHINTSQTGDFLVDDKYTFEIGGPTKSFKQIAGLKDGFLVVDNVEFGSKNKIPLWLFGFLD
jgi:predicted AAA+ superfamily ATPase